MIAAGIWITLNKKLCDFYSPPQESTLFQVAGEGLPFYHYCLFVFFIIIIITLLELWTECASTSWWDCYYWRARWPATAARARPRPPQPLLQPRPAGTRRWSWGGWWRSWEMWRRAGVTWAQKRKLRSCRGRGPPRRNQRIYAAWKQTEGSRQLVSDGFGMSVTTPTDSS